jgi:cytochrome d ubiquinol oxidase subunit II
MLASGSRAAAQRDLIERAIGPVWEADHVWLILVVVILFNGFPPAFAAIMIAMHVPVTLMLVGIMLRGSAFSFRSCAAAAIVRGVNGAGRFRSRTCSRRYSSV